jgi:biotin carboxylase
VWERLGRELAVRGSTEVPLTCTGNFLPANCLAKQGKQSALILASGWRLAYRALRCTAASFDRVYVLGTKEARLLAVSLYCHSFYQLPFEEGFSAASTSFITRLCEELRIDWVIPSDGPTTRFLTGAAAALTPKSYPVPDTATFDQLNDKSAFTALCQKLSLATPRTEVLPGLYQVRERFRDGRLALPLVLKPVNREGGDGVVVLYSEDSLKRVDLQYAPVLVQEYIDGRDVCAFYLCKEGRVKRQVVYYHGGHFIKFIEDQRIGDQCLKIIEATKYNGVIGFDFRQRNDGSFVFLECNPRFWYNMELTMLAGANFVKAGVESPDYQTFNASLVGKVVIRPRSLFRKVSTPGSRQQIRLAVLSYVAADFPLAVSIGISNAVRASRATASHGSGIHSGLNKAKF